MRQIPLAFIEEDRPSFESFQIGPNVHVMQHLCELSPFAASAPVYMWGGPGVGKSHLLQAYAAHVQGQGAQVGFFTPDSPLPWTFDEQWRAIVFDDCDRFDALRQHAAFALFIEATGAGVQVVGAGNAPPVDLPLRDDLRSRLGWGDVFQLHAVSEADCRAAIRRQAEHRGHVLAQRMHALAM